MKTLLISPSYYPQANASYFPLGLACISAYIKTQGHSVVGLNLNHMPTEERACAIKNTLDSHNIDVIGISGLTVAFNEIDRLMQEIRRINPQIPIVLGGGITSVEGELMMNTLRPDFAVVGEGEFIFSRLLATLEKGEDASKIAGIWCWEGALPKYTGDGESPKDLDELPLPDLDSFGIRDHIQLQGEHGQYSYHLTRLDVGRSFPISASRSCPFKCTFCHHAGMGTYKKRDIVRVVDQIEDYIKIYGINGFSIYDELFSANKARVVEFCRLLKERNIHIKWFCQLRMDQLDLPMLQMMRDTGCNYISFGIESGSDVVLDSMKKKITKKIISDAVKIVREAKIGIQGNFLFGDPVETEETIRESLQFQDDNELYFCDWSAVIPYAGTPIYNFSVEKGLIQDREIFMRSLCNISGYLYSSQVNMTQMSDDNYKYWYIYLRELNDQNHRKRCATIISGKIISRWMSEITVACPCCGCHQNMTFRFPFEQDKNGPILKGPVGIQGMNILCPECAEKMHLKAKDIPHMKVVYTEFQNEIDSIMRNNDKAIFMPSLDRFAATFLEDINIDESLVEDVYDTREFRRGRKFLGKMTKIIDQENVNDLNNKVLVVLPWIEYENVINLLGDSDVKPSKILCWNNLFL
ncbi:B12-binding domain-containing radical SAM protein [Methylomonas fluvii]|uniref:B12-binding domain-containing radical SAM protein n=1 Tax=Methylomonas fluvii TaxID=1854564 RepID=A0ABR9DGI0_9GAMM|nr:radical SAM protein [Methylomonas fluvii]MBD9362050.1 B12-binding domain-containing radical SAM protein [Methylomonas fluvii]